MVAVAPARAGRAARAGVARGHAASGVAHEGRRAGTVGIAGGARAAERHTLPVGRARQAGIAVVVDRAGCAHLRARPTGAAGKAALATEAAGTLPVVAAGGAVGLPARLVPPGRLAL